jgi:hypothetical protein
MTDFIANIETPRSAFTSVPHRYIVGAAAELHLPAGFGIELDALYRRLSYDGRTTLGSVLTNSRTDGNAWEFPLLVKYRFPGPVLKPFVAAGAAWDTLSGLKQAVVGKPAGGDPPELANSTSRGIVIGAGLEIHALKVRIVPELRYTRWGAAHFRDLNGGVLSRRNQAEFLLGIVF